ncbi:serine/arginine-rich splicing factor RS31-like isoform X2 [Hibiscus syriacus]|nr:serine/arginine-rich splicing factor RS31-like isoform X2 [Hibiscus syriacus]
MRFLFFFSRLGFCRRLGADIFLGEMRPVFVGNFEFETRQSELERLFSKYGRIERVDMKSGFAFVYFEDERDAEDAIRGLDNVPFGYDRRRLSVEWAKGERGRHRDGSRSTTSQRPTKTLFVINFDPIRTRERDITKHFEPYGKVLNVRIRRNFAFVQFVTQEDASKALEATQRSKLLDRVVSVEYALRDDDERDGRYESPRRGGSGRHGDSPYQRPPSPAYRRRPSPDYVGLVVLFMIAIMVRLMTGRRVPNMGDTAADRLLEGPGHEYQIDGESLLLNLPIIVCASSVECVVFFFSFPLNSFKYGDS